MAVLLKLPPELLEVIGRNLIKSSSDATHDERRMHLLSLARTCERMYNVLKRVLFENIGLFYDTGQPELGNKKLRLFALAIKETPALGLHIRKFELQVKSDYPRTYFPRVRSNMTTFWRRCEALGNIMHSYAPNLKILDMPFPMGCKFLDRSWPNWRTLTASSIDAAYSACHLELHHAGMIQGFEYHEGLKVGRLASILHSPPLRSLTMRTTHLRGGGLPHLQSGYSSVEQLTIYAYEMQNTTIAVLLRAPKALHEFRLPSCLISHRSYIKAYVEVDSADVYQDLLELPSPTALYEGLRHHIHCLERFHIHGASFAINLSLDTGHHSFRDFSHLESIEIDVTMLLGWKNCEHSKRPVSSSIALPPRDLGTLLPDSLQELKLYIDNDWHIRHGLDYLHQIMIGVNSEAKRLTRLRTISLAPEYLHCWTCSVEYDWVDLGEREAEVAAAMSLAESREIDLKVAPFIRLYAHLPGFCKRRQYLMEHMQPPSI